MHVYRLRYNELYFEKQKTEKMETRLIMSGSVKFVVVLVHIRLHVHSIVGLVHVYKHVVMLCIIFSCMGRFMLHKAIDISTFIGRLKLIKLLTLIYKATYISSFIGHA
jgi:hypothetical protein